MASPGIASKVAQRTAADCGTRPSPGAGGDVCERGADLQHMLRHAESDAGTLDEVLHAPRLVVNASPYGTEGDGHRSSAAGTAAAVGGLHEPQGIVLPIGGGAPHLGRGALASRPYSGRCTGLPPGSGPPAPPGASAGGLSTGPAGRAARSGGGVPGGTVGLDHLPGTDRHRAGRAPRHAAEVGRATPCAGGRPPLRDINVSSPSPPPSREPLLPQRGRSPLRPVDDVALPPREPPSSERPRSETTGSRHRSA